MDRGYQGERVVVNRAFKRSEADVGFGVSAPVQRLKLYGMTVTPEWDANAGPSCDRCVDHRVIARAAEHGGEIFFFAERCERSH